jgi:hypothetical protein
MSLAGLGKDRLLPDPPSNLMKAVKINGCGGNEVLEVSDKEIIPFQISGQVWVMMGGCASIIGLAGFTSK